MNLTLSCQRDIYKTYVHMYVHTLHHQPTLITVGRGVCLAKWCVGDTHAGRTVDNPRSFVMAAPPAFCFGMLTKAGQKLCKPYTITSAPHWTHFYSHTHRSCAPVSSWPVCIHISQSLSQVSVSCIGGAAFC